MNNLALRAFMVAYFSDMAANYNAGQISFSPLTIELGRHCGFKVDDSEMNTMEQNAVRHVLDVCGTGD